MANPEHLKILKRGNDAWAEWKLKNWRITPDLSGANLGEQNLGGADLSRVNLSGAILTRTHLTCAVFSSANLSAADLSESHLTLVDFNWADLRGANLSRTWISGSDFSGARLSGTSLQEAGIKGAKFGDTDLSTVRGLETVRHHGPSTIGIDTIYKSKGNIPEAFLRGAGVPEDFIVYMKSLAQNPIEFYSCFISYSSQDDKFAQGLHADLQQKGVRCWFAPEDLKIGDEFRTRIDESIRIYDKLMVVLSKNSIHSPWVKDEVEAAFEKEHKQNKPVLFPIRLDDTVMETDQAWAASLRRTRHIGDFRAWKDHDPYQKSFERLLRDLKA
jgi:uncharacterized protein YjbI with pentapeptide repeats